MHIASAAVVLAVVGGILAGAARPVQRGQPDSQAITATTSIDSSEAFTTIRMGARTIWVTSPTSPVPVGETATIGIVVEEPPPGPPRGRGPGGPAEDDQLQAPSPLPDFALDIDGVRVLARRFMPASPDKYVRFMLVFTLTSPIEKTFQLLLLAADATAIFRWPLPRVGSQPWGPVPTGLRLPQLGSSGARVEVVGPFDGDATTTEITIGGRPVNVLAETQTRSWFYSPADVTGSSEIRVRDRSTSASGLYRALGIELSAPRTSLQRGEKVDVTITVTGLHDLQSDAPLALKKGGVVSMEGGDSQTLRIRPGDVRAGSFSTKRTLTGLERGTFAVTATVWDPSRRPRIVVVDQDARVNGFRARKQGNGFELQFENVQDPVTGAPVTGEVPTEIRCLDKVPLLRALFFKKGEATTRTECLVFITPRIIRMDPE